MCFFNTSKPLPCCHMTLHIPQLQHKVFNHMVTYVFELYNARLRMILFHLKICLQPSVIQFRPLHELICSGSSLGARGMTHKAGPRLHSALALLVVRGRLQLLDPGSTSQLLSKREKKSGHAKPEVKSHPRNKSGSAGPQVSPHPARCATKTRALICMLHRS